jgi:hypothetical protein
MELIISIFAIYSLAFLIKESDGPWGIMAWLRNHLIRNQYVGVFFFKLLECYFCVGCHCGWMVYLLTAETYKLNFFILWTVAGGGISLMLETIRERLLR